jgi:Icc-related predicted phosphoesterase
MTRVLAFSDLHLSRVHAKAIRAAGTDADIVLGAGDFATMREGLAEVMGWLSPLDAKAIYVNGNSESVEELREATTAQVLHGTSTVACGLTVFGLGCAVPRTPFGSWSVDLDEEEAEALLSQMVAADILLCHAPPKGVADVSSSGESLGSVAVRTAIEQVQPRYCLCGHVHHSWGARGRIGTTEVMNLGPGAIWIEV